MRILVTGSKGQLGRECLAVLNGRHEVLGLDLPELDIAAPSSLAAAADPFRPDAIVNCAAFTNVDACEAEAGAARRANVEGPQRLAEYARRHGSRLIHISTDYVFDGQKPLPQPYTEDDPARPLSAYGRSKLDGEEAIRAAGCRHAILRTAWLYGQHGRNFLKTMLRLALAGPDKPIRVVNDQFGSPTWAGRLALQIEAVAAADCEGVYHATAEGWCSWFDLAGHFLRAMDVPHRLTPITTPEYPTPARRPANSILENRRLKLAGINRFTDWREDVDGFCRNRAALLQEAAPAGRGL